MPGALGLQLDADAERLALIYKKPKPVPEAVNELNLVNADGTPANFPQYWKRNTLVIDLSAIGAAAGGILPRASRKAPPGRCASAVRVRPGSVGQIEILGEERNILPVAAEGTAPIDLEFAPSVYTPKTAAIYISWGPMAAAVEEPSVPVSEPPAFVSPTEVPKPATEAPAGERQRHRQTRRRLSLRRRPAPDATCREAGSLQLPRRD